MPKSKIFLKSSYSHRARVFWGAAFICAIGVFLALPSAILLSLLLLPSLLVAFSDTQPGWSSVRTVFLFGIAASCHPIDLLWRSNQSVGNALALASDIRVLSISWASQAGGWLLTQTLPLIVARALNAKAERQIATLQQERLILIEEWYLP